MVVAWPIVIVMLIRDMFPVRKKEMKQEKKREFAVAREDLLEELSVGEIEHREKVHDPLGAVPDLPFGHLNGAWRKFLKGMQPGDELWSFSAYWTTNWGSKELRSGYVIVQGETIGPYYQTESKKLISGE